MDTAVIIALIAGAVSFIGVLVNLYIARQVRQANLMQPKLQSIASIASKSDEFFKGFLTEAERLRICCWRVLGHLEYMQNIFVSYEAKEDEYLPLKLSGKALEEAIEEAILVFSETSKTFEESWATLKGEIPRGIELIIRAKRHDCRNLARTTLAQLNVLFSLYEKEGGRKDSGVTTNIRRSEELLRKLLVMLDELISMIRAVRENKMTEGLIKN